MKILEDYSEWNSLIETLKEKKIRIVKEGKGYGKYKNKTTTIKEAFVSEGAKTVEMLWKAPGSWDRAEKIVFYLDGEPDYGRDSNIVAQAMRELNACWKIKELTGREISICGSASPILGHNKERSGKRYIAYEYDVKSAYSWGMLQELPDVNGECRMNDILQEGEIGFNTWIRDSDGARILEAEFEVGAKCRWIFKAIKSPYERFVLKYYKKKECATDKKEKARMKAFLNVVVGQM